jgi:deoxyribonuclease V
MYAVVDVDYRPIPGAPQHDEALAACVEFRSWSDARPSAEHVRRIPEVAAYVPGEFYRRELPCVLAVLGDMIEPLELLVVDGYVFLDGEGKPGLGAHVHTALGGKTPVIGVAKNRFRSNTGAFELLRGGSTRPLFVTAIGIAPAEATELIGRMHGSYRLPTLLKRVDRLCRDALLGGI